MTHVTRSEPTTFRFGRKQLTGVMGLRGSEYYKSKFYLAFPNLISCVRNSPGRCCFSQQGLSRVLLIIDGATACGGSVGLFPQLIQPQFALASFTWGCQPVTDQEIAINIAQVSHCRIKLPLDTFLY